MIQTTKKSGCNRLAKSVTIKKNPEINYPNMAKIMFGNIRIEVASDHIDPLELSKVIHSMMTP